jgi:hypothetical protein
MKDKKIGGGKTTDLLKDPEVQDQIIGAVISGDGLSKDKQTTVSVVFKPCDDGATVLAGRVTLLQGAIGATCEKDTTDREFH